MAVLGVTNNLRKACLGLEKERYWGDIGAVLGTIVLPFAVKLHIYSITGYIFTSGDS